MNILLTATTFIIVALACIWLYDKVKEEKKIQFK